MKTICVHCARLLRCESSDINVSHGACPICVVKAMRSDESLTADECREFILSLSEPSKDMIDEALDFIKSPEFDKE